MFSDNEDPWGMTVDGFCSQAGEFALMSDKDANSFIGYPDEQLLNVRVTENGDVRMKTQALFEYGESTALVTYTVPKRDAY